jgi:hypothetical protein
LRRDGPKEYTLDADATEIIGEKADALFTYNWNKGYMPMIGFLYEIPVCLLDEFREGNEAPAFGQKEFYLSKNVSKSFSQMFPIFLNRDLGFIFYLTNILSLII